VGSRKNPVWRVVVADQRSPRDGRVIETVGRYNPQRQPSEIVLNRERIDAWLARGAQPTNTVRKLIQASERAAPPAAAEAAPESVAPAIPDEEGPIVSGDESAGPAVEESAPDEAEATTAAETAEVEGPDSMTPLGDEGAPVPLEDAAPEQGPPNVPPTEAPDSEEAPPSAAGPADLPDEA
jgi:small subunit ribosomal protein S16